MKTNRTRAIAIGIVVAATGFASTALAYDVVVVESLKNPVYDQTVKGFSETCGGKVITFTLNKDRLLEPDDLAAMTHTPPAAILAMGTSALTEVLSRKPAPPVLFTAVTEKPIGNIAGGVLMDIPMERQLETLLKIAPSVKTIGVVYNPARTQYFLDGLLRAAKARGVTVNAVPARTPPDAVKALETLLPAVDAYIFSPDPSIHSEPLERSAGLLAAKLKKPVIGFKGSQLANGFLFASEMDPLEMGRQAGEAVHDLVSGKKLSAGVAPVKNFKLILNPKVADELGLKIPAEILSGAAVYGEDTP